MERKQAIPGGTGIAQDEGSRPSIGAVLEGLNETLRELEKTRPQGGATLTYIPWHQAHRRLVQVTQGFFSYRVVDKQWARITQSRTDFTTTVEFTLHCQEGDFTVQGTGIEEDILNTSSYGDYQSKAEAMARNRALASVLLGLYLYH